MLRYRDFFLDFSRWRSTKFLVWSVGACRRLGVRLAAGARQPDVDRLDHGAGRVQPLRGHLQAVSGDPGLYDETSPSAGARQRTRHHRLQHTALPRTPPPVLHRGHYTL